MLSDSIILTKQISLIVFILIFIQYKARETLKVSVYILMLYERKKRNSEVPAAMQER